jgi:hypothetical protein
MIALRKLCTILHAEHNHIQYQTSGFINFKLLTVNKQAKTVDYIEIEQSRVKYRDKN